MGKGPAAAHALSAAVLGCGFRSRASCVTVPSRTGRRRSSSGALGKRIPRSVPSADRVRQGFERMNASL